MPRGRNDYQSAQIQGRLWTPELLRPVAWFDAADLSTITITTDVSEWRDKSGNGRHATQSSAGNRPIYSAFSLQGLPGLTVQDDWLDATYSANGTAVWMAAMPNATSATVYYPIGLQSGGQGGILAGGADATVTQRAGWWNGTTALLSSNTVTAGKKFILSGATDSTIPSRRFRLTPGAEVTDSVSQSVSAIRIGKRADGLWPFDGVISEVVFGEPFTGNRTRDLVEGYLGWKWDIPLAADHPFANRPPLIGD